MKNNINEHDMTKKMMDVMRGGYSKKLITEEEGSDEKDTISLEKGDDRYTSVYNEMTKIVDPSIEITNFKIYPVDKNVIVEGNFLNNHATFRMELRENEIEIDTTNIGLNDDNYEILRKFQGYFKNWKDDWSIKINSSDITVR